ncbi:MAG: YdeI family protein [Roseimicrobium sp.]
MNSPNHHDFQRFANATEWEKWLAKQHRKSSEVWLLIQKKGSGGTGLTIGDALDVALCYGWIDSHRRGYDKTHYLQRYSPRRSQSPWSKLNVNRAEALINAGLMQAPGQEQIAVAQTDGRWAAAYEPQRDLNTPPDVTTALAADKQAGKAFELLSKSARYTLFLPVLKATTPEIRARRLKKMIASLDAKFTE